MRKVRMAEAEEYIAVSIHVLKRFTNKLPFDLYVQRSENKYTKLFKINGTLDWERVNNYIAKGISNFYVTKDQHEAYEMVAREMAVKYLGKDDSISVQEAISLTKEMLVLSSKELMEQHKINTRTIENATTSVMGCIDLLGKEPKAMIKIVSLMTDKIKMMKHATVVSLFSVTLAKSVEIESNINLSNIGLGGFLHDLGVSQISFDPEDKETLTQEEWKEVKKHPELGKALLDDIPGINTEVRLIILQHHEQPNGNGYPNGLRGQAIFLPSRIVSIADRFATLVTAKPYRNAYTSQKALALMEEDTGKFDRDLLNKFKTIFASV